MLHTYSVIIVSLHSTPPVPHESGSNGHDAETAAPNDSSVEEPEQSSGDQPILSTLRFLSPFWLLVGVVGIVYFVAVTTSNRSNIWWFLQSCFITFGVFMPTLMILINGKLWLYGKRIAENAKRNATAMTASILRILGQSNEVHPHPHVIEA